jgi:hypothetical protein
MKNGSDLASIDLRAAESARMTIRLRQTIRLCASSLLNRKRETDGAGALCRRDIAAVTSKRCQIDAITAHLMLVSLYLCAALSSFIRPSKGLNLIYAD